MSFFNLPIFYIFSLLTLWFWVLMHLRDLYKHRKKENSMLREIINEIKVIKEKIQHLKK